MIGQGKTRGTAAMDGHHKPKLSGFVAPTIGHLI